MSLQLLVVEDNADLRQLLCEILREFGYLITAVGSAEEALETMRAGVVFDVLFTDIQLPGMTGIDLAQSVLLHLPHVEVIFASGYSDSILTKLDFPAHFFIKPYDIDRLNQLLTSFENASFELDKNAINV